MKINFAYCVALGQKSDYYRISTQIYEGRMQETIDILNNLITVSKDGEAGFKKVAEEVTDAHLKSVFTNRASGCTQAIAELQAHVTRLGGTPTDSGSILGALHRGWVDVKSAVTNRDNATILEECYRGEESAEQAFAKALENNDLSQDVRSFIQKLYDGVKQNYDLVARLKNEHQQ